MVVTVNGKPMELPEGLTIEDLLVRLAVPRQFTAVALNREIAPKASYTTTSLSEGDKVEIVRPMGGG
jgi:sulfur carrier protein